MGMYDYLGGEQIKIFYHPIFQEKDYITGKPSTWHSGGILADFDETNELPLETLYYKYPKNFIVYDFKFSDEDIWVIKDGYFKEFKTNEYLTENDLGEAVYDYYGQELNIKTLEDFYTVKEEYINIDKTNKRLENELFPSGLWETLKNNKEEFDLKEPQLNKIRENTWGKFNKKWYKEDKYYLEKQLGEFIDCYIILRGFKDGKVTKYDNPIQRYLDCKQATKDFIKENKNIVDKYKFWLDDKELNNKIDEIINEILN